MGRLIPSHLPMGKKAEIRSQIDLPNEELHCGTVPIGLECMGEMSVVDCLGPFCSCHNIIIHLATHSSQHTAAADLIEARKVLALPNARLSGLKLATVPMYQINGWPASL